MLARPSVSTFVIRDSFATTRQTVAVAGNGDSTMHRSDRLGFGIIGGIALLIGGGYLLFRIFGDSYLITLLIIAAWFVLLAFTIKFFVNYDKK